MMRVGEKKGSIDVMIFWVLLVLTLELKHLYPNFKIKAKNTPEIYSAEIKKIDEYLGYISWTEIYKHSKIQDKIDDAKDLLWELIAKDPNRPEAYCKLWTIHLTENKIDKCLDICERLFLDGSEFDENEYMSVSLYYTIIGR